VETYFYDVCLWGLPLSVPDSEQDPQIHREDDLQEEAGQDFTWFYGSDVFMMAGEEYNDWTVEQCDQCRRLLEDFDYLEHGDELPTKWLCIGRMINKSETPDEHEKFNEIRLCIQGSKGIESWEWTPFEASRVGLGLTFAVTDFLLELQPGKDDSEE